MFTKNGYKQYKISPEGAQSQQSACCCSFPLLAPVCLPSRTAEAGTERRRGRAKRGAFWETESSGAFIKRCQTRTIFIILQFSLATRWFIDYIYPLLLYESTVIMAGEFNEWMHQRDTATGPQVDRNDLNIMWLLLFLQSLIDVIAATVDNEEKIMVE